MSIIKCVQDGRQSFLALIFPVLFLSQTSVAIDKLEISQFTGKTCLQMVMDAGGIKAALDKDEKASFKFADKETIKKAADDFDPSVFKKVTRFFKDGDSGLDKLVDALGGQSATPATAAGVIAKQLKDLNLLADPNKIGLAAVSIAPFLSLASGAGTEVVINDKNFYYNFGYKPGSQDKVELAKDVKSGRSFGASPGHRALDASDVYYLSELDAFLIKNKDPSAFYESLLRILAQDDPSGYSKLNLDG